MNNLIRRFVLRRKIEFLKGAGLFDADWYLNKYADLRGDKIEALRHYIRYGRLEGRAPTRRMWELNELARQTFDPAWYADQNREFPEALDNPTGHYVEYGFFNGSAPTRRVWELEKFACQVFDASWYAHRNPDVVAGGKDPFTHYVEYGFAEGRQPSPAYAENAIFAELGRKHFDRKLYLSLNPDVLQAGADPVRHYIEYGYSENRPTRLAFDEPALLPEVGRDPLRWYYVGDTLEWLSHHSHLTGVGRVTSEILLAGLFQTDEAFIPCVKDHTGVGLTRLVDQGPISKIAQAAGYKIDDIAGDEHFASLGKLSAYCPARGDHVVFAGVVWSASDALLLASLRERGVSVSVLVHDIIPITNLELVSAAHARSFVHWLSVAVQAASVIFVSNPIVAQEISKWLLRVGLFPKISIKEIPFGTRTLRPDCVSARNLKEWVGDNFVLSVGTIDRRKNQRLLCDAWLELYNSQYKNNLPQLVLVGRDDEGLSSEPRFSRLVELEIIAFIDFASDFDVAELYRTCLFTVFPSTSEGYGLPVAESIAYGKLCLSSNLAVIRSHAGDLVWYFDPRSQQSLIAQLERALSRPAERLAAESRIQSEHRPASWTATVRSIVEASDALMSPQLGTPPSKGDGDSILRRCDLPQVSFLIVNKNSASEVIQLVRWINTNVCDVSHEIIIADNGSDAGDLEILSFILPLINIIQIGCDRFDGEAFNIAAETSCGRQLCILSGVDLPPPEGLLAAMQDLQGGNSAQAVVSFSAAQPSRTQTAGSGGSEYNLRRLDLDTLVYSLSGSPPRGGRFFDVMLFGREVFFQVKGFDLAFEPGPYEDIDLVANIIAVGNPVFQLEHAKHYGTSADEMAVALDENQYIYDLNRRKFMDRWSSLLKGEGIKLRSQSGGVPSSLDLGQAREIEKPVAILHTPYPLTPGGGERYLLSIAALLSASYKVVLAIPHLYSRLRLRSLAEELSLNLDLVEIRLLSDLTEAPPPAVFVSMDNFVVPRQDAIGQKNFYICQFPFPMHVPVDAERRSRIAGYQKYIAYSVYAKRHIEARLDSIQAPDVPVCLVPPPVAQIRPSAKRMSSIMTVGRFFVGGHAKRHDLLIQAFKLLKERCDDPVEFHVVGSTIPEKKHMDYVERLVNMGLGLPIHFHLNARPEILTELYASTEVYWHGAGLEADLTNEPWAAEHFGISVVEAMSAGAIPFALASGGPREIIEHGVNGFLYDSIETLVESTRTLLSCDATDRQILSQAAIRRAEDFSPEVFERKIKDLLLD